MQIIGYKYQIRKFKIQFVLIYSMWIISDVKGSIKYIVNNFEIKKIKNSYILLICTQKFS